MAAGMATPILHEHSNNRRPRTFSRKIYEVHRTTSRTRSLPRHMTRATYPDKLSRSFPQNRPHGHLPVPRLDSLNSILRRRCDGNPPFQGQIHLLRRPCKRWQDPTDLYQEMVASRRDFKVFACMGTTNANLVRTLTILYTGASPNFIRK